jgi:hypothetical protein
MSVIFWHIQEGAIGAQTRNADFTETGFTIWTILFKVVRYSAMNNGLPSNNRVSFEDKVLKGIYAGSDFFFS